MTNQKHGAMSWSDSSFKNEGGTKGKDMWLRLKPGSNPIRVLTDPYQYHQHKGFKFEGEAGYGHRIPCSAKNGSCVVCKTGDKAKKRWYIGVIDRASNSYKVLDVNWSVLSDIQTYADDGDWGNPSEYDFDIIVNPNGGPQNYYKTVAKPKKPLSANDLMLKDKVDLEYLENKCIPLDPSKVEEIFNGLKEKANATSSKEQAPDTMSFEKEEDEDFQDADAKPSATTPGKIKIPF